MTFLLQEILGMQLLCKSTSLGIALGINLQTFPGVTQVCQASTLLLKQFSLLKDLCLGSVMAVPSVAGV